MNGKFIQGGNQHIRKPNGQAVNLNSAQGADYVLDLQRRLSELQAAETKPRRGRPRKKMGPKETKA